MAIDKYLVLLCVFSLHYVMCQLNLSEESPCTSNNTYKGTCVSLFKCGSAVLTHLYRNAGFTEEKHFPQLPDICSNKNAQPVVCCTDCKFSEKNEFLHSAVAPHGVLVSRKGPKAWQKCLDYFQRLPYPCRGIGQVHLMKNWNEENQCHNITLRVSLSVNGENPEMWKFPHLALLGYGDDQKSAQWLCEGSVISERFIVTAARCTNAGVLGNVAHAAVGLQNRHHPENDWNIYKIQRFIIHPDYNEPSWYNDIALLETETEIRFSTDVLPACLDVGKQDISIAEAAGIPDYDENNTEANNLQVIYQDKQTRPECTLAYTPNNNMIHGFDHKTQMCYTSRKDTDYTCKRISGSPLQVDQFKCQYTVVGVTSQKPKCENSGVPDFYTRILHYVPWIESIVWSKED